ncbi:hypothetical protein L596_013805 [Steinernema carpocapsae]|uniref:TIL domain-containing protein n=1 Tax=Steinernema carpocapsae TaxID=34508 RepID=A0A4U5P256_STECR|nr:hypothetical protein L596_013805 [Steinernema carpocapsae]
MELIPAVLFVVLVFGNYAATAKPPSATTVDPNKDCAENEIYYVCKPTCPMFCSIRYRTCRDDCQPGCDCKPGFKKVDEKCVALVDYCAGDDGYNECQEKKCGVNATKPLIDHVCVKTIPRVCTWSCPCPNDVVTPDDL